MVGAYQQPLLTLCYAYLHDRQLAEDAVQETFLRAYRALDTFRGESSERPWLTAIAVNVCRSMRRIYPDDTLFPDGIRNTQGKDFGQWTHEERAQFSARCKPLVDTCLAGNPYYPNRDTSLFHLTRPVCGVPDGQGLSEAEAVAVAKAQALALGATERSFATRETVMYDDVTRADAPVWRVSFTLPRDQSDAG